MAEREQQAMHTFVELADTLASEYDLSEFLQLLVERSVEILDVDTGGVLLENPDGKLSIAAATSEEMKAVERAEMEHGEGPCLEAYRDGDQVMAPDLRECSGRWPAIAPLAVEIGLLAVYAFPLRLRGDRIGALNLYRTETGAFDDEDIRLAQAFADVAAIGILQERKVTDAQRRSDQLQHALGSRVVIEQAKGVLAGQEDITPDEAFDRIRIHARTNHRLLRDVCQDVVEHHLLPG